MKDYTYEDIISIIDDHFGKEREFTFVVDGDLADDIATYISSNSYVSDETEDNEINTDEKYYVSVLFDMKHYCENDSDAEVALYYGKAKGNNGKWLFSDGNVIDYYFDFDISDDDVDKYFCGSNRSTWTKFNYIDEDYINKKHEEDSCDYDCSECLDISDSEREEIKLIVSYVDKVNSTSCPHCIMEQLVDLAIKFKKIGYQDAKDEMKCFLEDDE